MIACLVSYALVILFVRNLSPDFTAYTKVFVSIPEVTLGEAKGMFSGLFKDRERTDLILTQRALVQSYPIYQAIKDSTPPGKKTIKSRTWDFTDAAGNFLRMLILGRQHEISAGLYDWGYFAFLRRLSFTTDIQGGNFSVGYKASDPREAIRISRQISEALLDLNLEIAAKRTAKVTDFLQRKVQETNDNLQKANEAIAEFVRKHNLPHREKLLEERYRAYVEAQRAVAKAEQEIAEKTVRVEQTRELVRKLKQQMKESVSKTNEPRIRALMLEISKFETALLTQQNSGLPTRSQADVSRRLRRLRSQLSQEINTGKFYDTDALAQGLERALTMVEVAEAESTGAQAMYEEVKRQVAAYENEMKKYPELEAKLEQLLFVQKQYGKMQEALTQNYLAVLTQGDVRTSKLVILQDPMLDSDILGASKTKKLLFFCILVTAAIICGIGGLDFYRENIISSQQLKTIQSPVYLGKFPHVRARTQRTLVFGFEENLQIAQLAFRMTRSVPPGRIIVMCSSRSMAGKTITVTGVATALAKLNKRVLLVDGDVRAAARKLMHYFRNRRSRSVAVAEDLEWLTKRVKDGTFQEWQGKRFLTVCPIIANPGQPEQHAIDIQTKLANYLQACKPHFDYVLVDAGPLYFVETGMLLECADTVIIAAPEGNMTIPEMAEASRLVDLHRPEGSTFYSILTNTRLEANLDSAYRYYMPQKNKDSDNSNAA